MSGEDAARDRLSAGRRTSGWTPLLEGEPRDRALAAVQRLAAGIQEAEGLDNPTLSGGDAGLALFYCYLSEWREGDDSSLSKQHLNRAIRAAGRSQLPPGLYAGLAGIGWACHHIRARLTPEAAVEQRSLDEGLLAYATRRPWRHRYDLIAGAVGLGVYAVERLPRRIGAALLEQVVQGLWETAEWSDAGVTWYTPPARRFIEQGEAAPVGYYNLGMAHGVPGVIGLLGLACASGLTVEKARPLLDGAVRWLLAQRLPPEAGGSFARWVLPGDAVAARSAWCYGDPGIAAALLLAAACVPDSWWREEALAVALGAALRPAEEAGVRHPGLCHGSAGLAHLYNRMYQATGDERFRGAGLFWFGRTLELCFPEKGSGIFQPHLAEFSGSPGRNSSVEFLMGAAGVGLALLAACTSVEPEWDRLLLCSVPTLAGVAATNGAGGPSPAAPVAPLTRKTPPAPFRPLNGVARVGTPAPEAPVRLGALDNCPLREGVSPRRALQESIALAGRLEEWGYTRSWYAEHHTVHVAQSSPELMLPVVASRTAGLRVGTGGLLLALTDPLKVARDFRLLETLFPGRIELGIGRGGGDPEKHLQNVRELLESLWESSPQPGIPGGTPWPEVWLLGMSASSAGIAARCGAGYCHGLFFQGSNPSPEIVEEYLQAYEPSAAQPQPQVCIAAAGICAETAAEAERLRALHTNPYLVPTVVGSPEECREQAEALLAKYGARQFLFLDLCPTPEARCTSYQALAATLLPQ